MGGIAEQKRPAVSKVLGHAVMHAVGGEPVYVFDVHFQLLDGAAADVDKLQGFGTLGAFVTHRADQSRAAFAGQWKHREKIRLVQVQMQLAIQRRAAGRDIGDVENLLIGAAGEVGVEGFAHHRTGAVATGQIAGLTDFLPAIGQAQMGGDGVAGVREAVQRGIALDADAVVFEALE